MANDIYERIQGEVPAKTWDGSMRQALEILDWLQEHGTQGGFLETNETASRDQPEIVIYAEDGNKHVRRGDWIVKENGVWLLYSAGTFRRLYKKKEDK